MGSYDINSRRGVFRSGELNTENVIPSLGGMRDPDAGTSDVRSETAMRGAAARIVEIGGQFDTQHLMEPDGAGPNLRQVTSAGYSLQERAARFHATHAKESRKAPEVREAGVSEMAGSGPSTVQGSPSQGTGSGSMGGGPASTPRGEEMLPLLSERSGAKRKLDQSAGHTRAACWTASSGFPVPFGG